MIHEIYTTHRRMSRPMRLDEKDGVIRGMPGERIEDVADAVIQLTKKQKKPQRLSFNGTVFEITAQDSVAAVVNRFRDEFERQRLAYLSSPEGIAAAAARVEEVKQKQAKVEALLAVPLGRNHEAVLAWLLEWEDAAGDSGVKVRWQTAIAKLETLGYSRNRNANGPDASEADRERHLEWLKSDSDAMAHYIVGQAIDCMYVSMPPHPIVSVFVKEWMERAV